MSLMVKKQSLIGKAADFLMLPVMYLLQFPSLESPQRTHRWNNTKYSVGDIGQLNPVFFISIPGDSGAHRRWLGPVPLFHMPLVGGWKKFVVLEPKVKQDQWYIGWIPGDVIGISRIGLTNRVRLLRGPQTAFFFGLNEHGEQIELQQVGSGEMCTKHDYKKVPLL